MNDREQFDADAFLADFDSQFSQGDGDEEAVVPEQQEEVKPEVEEPAVEAEAEPKDEEPTETPTEVEPEPETQPEPVNEAVSDPDLHKRNEAFKKLREEKERLEQSDKFLADLATQYGMTKEELITKFREEQTVKQAAAQGIPVEQFKRMQQLETEVQTIKQKYAQEAFNFEAERLVQKYSIPANQVQDVFSRIGALGLDVLSNPKLLEIAYKALNYDVALQKGRQAQLEETKKRRETTASPSLGTKGTNVDTSETDMDSEIDSFLKEKLGK
jgi:hypothetical protein